MAAACKISRYMASLSSMTDGLPDLETTCQLCKGSGMVYDHEEDACFDCKYCHGSGFTPYSRSGSRLRPTYVTMRNSLLMLSRAFLRPVFRRYCLPVARLVLSVRAYCASPGPSPAFCSVSSPLRLPLRKLRITP
jgi:hypothetical protein